MKEKLFFAKYIPVDGEIKEGISVKEKYSINPKIVEVIAVNEDGMINCKGENLWYVPEALQKVKLFLCSRDIQIGDKYYHNEYYPYPTGNIANTNSKVMDAHMMVANEGENYEGDWAYKVLGQISSDATWVKEGDEFLEDQIQQDSELYGWNKEYNTEKDFQKFFDKSLSKTATHFIYEGETDYLDEAGTINLNFRVYKKMYKVKGPCGHFH